MGIPPEGQKHLFELFHCARNIGCIYRTGLGTPIVKRAVEMYQGSITVESAVEAGTTFTITLPYQPDR